MTTVGQLIISGLLIGGIYALMSLGLTLVFGVLRVVNFAHGEFLMIAMYGAWAFSRLLGLNPYFAAIAIVPAMFLFGALVYRLVVSSAIEKPHLVVVFATMGLSIFLQNVALMAMTADLRDVPPVFARCVPALQRTCAPNTVGLAGSFEGTMQCNSPTPSVLSVASCTNSIEPCTWQEMPPNLQSPASDSTPCSLVEARRLASSPGVHGDIFSKNVGERCAGSPP